MQHWGDTIIRIFLNAIILLKKRIPISHVVQLTAQSIWQKTCLSVVKWLIQMWLFVDVEYLNHTEGGGPSFSLKQAACPWIVVSLVSVSSKSFPSLQCFSSNPSLVLCCSPFLCLLSFLSVFCYDAQRCLLTCQNILAGTKIPHLPAMQISQDFR